MCVIGGGPVRSSWWAGLRASRLIQTHLHLGAHSCPFFPLSPCQVYKECMESPQLSAIHLTQVGGHGWFDKQPSWRGLRVAVQAATAPQAALGGLRLELPVLLMQFSTPPPILCTHQNGQVESEVECDTFMPPVDEQRFKLWSASAPQRDTPDGTRYSFLCCELGRSRGACCACCA